MDMAVFKHDKFLLESLKTEILVMRKMTSQNVIKLYDVIEDSKTTYIILEYCNQGDLSKFIRSVFFIFIYFI
jgi:serine/threonine-protein kinase ULK/ATG1